MGILTVIAMGGNAILDPNLPPTIENQYAVTARAMVHVADYIEQGTIDDRIVLTHGNGPQVGFNALRHELTRDIIQDAPLDSLVADTQGSIGYLIQRALREELRMREMPYTVVTVVTEVEVNPDDHAFQEPTKPIGRFYTEDEAKKLAAERGWRMVEDAHRGWRRVVPSPAPVRIVQLDAIAELTRAGRIVVCCGGGGIPIVRRPDGSIRGIEGVIDKDRASALLGVRMGARRLIITTGVDGVYTGFGTPEAKLLPELTLAELERLIDAGEFPPGSMGPKAKAASRFLRHGGEEVFICKPDQLVDALERRTGTRIVRG